jgi:hypothetical protein
MTPDELFREFEAGFPARRFSTGVLIAFIDLSNQNWHAQSLTKIS